MTKVPDPSSTAHASEAIDDGWNEDPLNYMGKAFIAFLQTVFESAPVGNFKWNSDHKTSELIVTEENPVNVESVEQKPVISVVMGASKFNGSSLDDMQELDMTTGASIHTDLIPGHMSLNCMTKDARQESRWLAWLCARHVWILRKIFIKETHIHEVGRNAGISPTTPAGALVIGDSSPEWVSTAVTFPFFLQWRDKVTPLNTYWNGRPIRPLNAMTVAIRTRMKVAQASQTANENAARERLWGEAGRYNLRPPRIRGRLITQAHEDDRVAVPSVPIESEHKV